MYAVVAQKEHKPIDDWDTSLTLEKRDGKRSITPYVGKKGGCNRTQNQRRQGTPMVLIPRARHDRHFLPLLAVRSLLDIVRVKPPI